MCDYNLHCGRRICVISKALLILIWIYLVGRSHYLLPIHSTLFVLLRRLIYVDLIVILQHWQIVLKDPSSHGLVFYNNFQNAKSDDCQQAQMFDWPTGWQKVFFHQSVNLQDRIELLC